MHEDPLPVETCWTIIGKAAFGDAAARETFARTYWPVVQGFLSSRWRGRLLERQIDDTVQEVFLDCFKARGALEHVERGRSGGFRGFLYGVVRNIALRAERKAHREQPAANAELTGEESELESESASRLFEREWARALVQSAADRMEASARELGAPAERRVELLRLRFHEGLPIRDIAARWAADAAVLHREFARARREFKAALEAEVAFHLPGSRVEIERECARVLELLS